MVLQREMIRDRGIKIKYCFVNILFVLYELNITETIFRNKHIYIVTTRIDLICFICFITNVISFLIIHILWMGCGHLTDMGVNS